MIHTGHLMSEPTGYPDLDALLPRLDAVPTLAADALEAERIAVLGRKSGALTAALKTLALAAVEERKRYGAAVNQLKRSSRRRSPPGRKRSRPSGAGARRAGLDLTMPGRSRWVGAEHPVTQVVDEIVEIFRELGFAVAVGPEVETEWYNFLALNFPADHPAMDMHDTLYLDAPPAAGEPSGRLLLRTHTSPVQIRTMLAAPPPVRVVIPGMVYRNDAFDASHPPAFSQIEGLAVDEGISFVDLKATLTHFARRFFSPTTKTRFRPSFFPFTEPSAEMDVECQLCHGSGCPACKGTGWMEILGCGMVHRGGARERAGSIRSATPAGPSAWGRTGSRCCATACRTSGCCSAGTCGSWRRSVGRAYGRSRTRDGARTSASERP